MTPTNLKEKIESFNYFYEMSDDMNKWSRGQREEKEIRDALMKLTPDQILELKNELTVGEDLLNRYWKDELDVQPTEPTPTNNSNGHLSIIMKRAHAIRKRTSESMSVSLCRSWAGYNLGMRMSRHAVSFAYKKKDGTHRRAKGTLKIGKTSAVKRTSNPKVLAYFDIEKNGWRSFRLENLISIAV